MRTMRRAVDDVARNKLELKEIRCAFIERKMVRCRRLFAVLVVLCGCGGSPSANVGGLSVGTVVDGTSRRGASAVGACWSKKAPRATG